MINREIQKRTEKLIQDFQNGKERYLTEPLLHQIVDTLARGESEINIIDKLLEIIKNQQSRLSLESKSSEFSKQCDVRIHTIKEVVMELCREKYQIERNGLAKAVLVLADELKELLK
jgi:hypothetical protein